MDLIRLESNSFILEPECHFVVPDIIKLKKSN